jgi:predicted ATP-grasp superfamily ATP-dependent carboligase
MIDDELEFPQILKPRTFEYFDELGAKNLIIQSKQELAEVRKKLSGRLHHYVMQQVIGGGDDHLWVCNCTFNKMSDLVSAFVFQRYHTTPPHFGVTSVAVSRYNDTIVQHVTAIGRMLRYTGPAMFEFKLDPADNIFKYIEINPRIGMCNYFDTRCGVNNVFNTYCLAADLPLPSQSRQTDSTVFINLFPDMKSRLRDGEDFWTIAVSYMKFLFRRRVGAYWAISDPMPAVLWIWHRVMRRSD